MPTCTNFDSFADRVIPYQIIQYFLMLTPLPLKILFIPSRFVDKIEIISPQLLTLPKLLGLENLTKMDVLGKICHFEFVFCNNYCSSQGWKN